MAVEKKDDITVVKTSEQQNGMNKMKKETPPYRMEENECVCVIN